MSKTDSNTKYDLAGYFVYRDGEYWHTTRSAICADFYKPPRFELIPIYTKTKPR